MVYQIFCQAHLKEAGLTQNQETMNTIKYHNPDLLYPSVEGPHKYDGNEIAFG